jgi:hypothetical protein
VISREKLSGFGLLQVVIALALLSGVALVFSRVVINTTRGQKSVELKGGFEDLRTLFRRGVDCSQSMPSPCVPGAYIALKSVGGGVLLDASGGADGQAFGDYHLRASCVPSGPGGLPYLNVEARFTNPREIKDPVLQPYNDGFAPLYRGTATPGLCIGGGFGGEQLCEAGEMMVGLSSDNAPICSPWPQISHSCAVGSYVQSIQGQTVTCSSAPLSTTSPSTSSVPVGPATQSVSCTLKYKGYGSNAASCTPAPCQSGYTSSGVTTKSTGTWKGVLGSEEYKAKYNFNGSAMCVVSGEVCTGRASGDSKVPSSQNVGVECECTRTCTRNP